ncbi:MAG: hypothetical protein V4760_02420 [Bdellovibrionota bacterium]
MKPIRNVSRVTDTTVLLIGLVAGILVGLFSFALDVAGWNHVSPSLLLGELLSGRTDSFGLQVGFSSHLIASLVFAYLYSLVFRSSRRSGVGIGLHVALFHWVVIGLAVSFLRTGPFALWDGAEAAISFFFSHLLFGAVVGFLFDRAAIGFDHPRPISTPIPPQRELSRSQRVRGTIRV